MGISNEKHSKIAIAAESLPRLRTPIRLAQEVGAGLGSREVLQ